MAHRAVFFDFGGTLFSYGGLRAHFDALLGRIAREHGLETKQDELRRVYRMTMMQTFARFQERPFYLHRDLFAHAHRGFLHELGLEPGTDTGNDFYEAQSELGLARVEVREDARATLETLRDRGLHLSIVSNIDDDQFEPLFAQLELRRWFDCTTTSEEARSCKPDPGIFRMALRKAGEPRPEEVVFVGDSIPHDVAGAAALGMTTVLLGHTPDSASPAPDHVISRLGELLEIVHS